MAILSDPLGLPQVAVQDCNTWFGARVYFQGFFSLLRRIKGGYAVMRLQDQLVISKQQQRAAEFLQSRLYSPQSNRAPGEETDGPAHAQTCRQLLVVDSHDRPVAMESVFDLK